MSDVVKIRGLKTGLQLQMNKDVDFEEVKKVILEKLESGSRFFIRGTTVFVDKDVLNEEQIEELRRMFHRHGMLFSDKMPVIKPKNPPKPVINPEPMPTPAPIPKVKKLETTRIRRTIRGGEEIRTEASVVIDGNVNPGAQIIAGGNIDIRGTCRGIVHAGAFGDRNAYVYATTLEPTQIRIADLVARPPDKTKDNEESNHVSFRARIANFIAPPAKNTKTTKPARAFINDKGEIAFEIMNTPLK